MNSRRRGLTAGLALALSGMARQAVGAEAKDEGYVRELKWNELVPDGWNPLATMPKPGVTARMRDDDPRTQDLLQDMREVWDNAPTRSELDGRTVRISGYVVPLDAVKGEVKEFLLVPYFGACIHSPPPPANQILHVTSASGSKLRSMDVVTVQGSLHTARSASAMGTSGYRFDATSVELYQWAPSK